MLESLGLESPLGELAVRSGSLAALVRPIQDPVSILLIIVAIMLLAPLLFERLRMPGIIGLILAGVVTGPYGIGLLERDETTVLLGTVGLLFLMFLGGLETSLGDLKNAAGKAIAFGLATFLVPMVFGTAVMMALGYSLPAAVLVASCLASHTLIGLPILSRLGIMRTPVVTATLGATLITNVLALLVLAVVVQANEGELTLTFWLSLIPSLGIFTAATLYGVPAAGRWFFRRFGHDEGAEFTFVIGALLVVSFAADRIQVEPVIGAFLAGVAIAQIVPRLSPLMNRIQFIGNTIFVPFFLISVGMLVNPLILVEEPRSLLVAGAMIVAEISSKYVAAWLPGRYYGLSSASISLSFGLSVAQAAATLAAITVGYNIEVVDDLTVNGTIAMILATCVVSPWICARWGRQVKDEIQAATDQRPSSQVNSFLKSKQRILAPIANPSTKDDLLRLALILARKTNGILLPLNVVSDRSGAVSTATKLQQEQLLESAASLANAAVVPVEPIMRVDDSVERGIVRTADERGATLVVCGWKGYSTYRDNFFGSGTDEIIRRSSIPVLLAHLPTPLSTIRRVVLTVLDAEYGTDALQQTAILANTLATELSASLQVFQVLTLPGVAKLSSAQLGLDNTTRIAHIQGNSLGTVAAQLLTGDLLVLSSVTHPYVLGQTALGIAPEAIARRQSSVSIVIAHFPSPL